MAKRTEFQKSIVKFFAGDFVPSAKNIYVDHVVCKADGSAEVKKGYFYRCGMTATKWAAEVADALNGARLNVVATGRDDYADWPRTSYFVAIVREG